MKSKHITVKKISIYESASLYTAHHAITIDVDFRIKFEKIEDLKERFKAAFSDAFISPLVRLTIITE